MYPTDQCIFVSDSISSDGKYACSVWKAQYACNNMWTGEKVCGRGVNGEASCCVPTSEVANPCSSADGFVKSNSNALKGYPGCECAPSNGVARKTEGEKPICDKANSTTSIYGSIAGVMTDLYQDCGMYVGEAVGNALGMATFQSSAGVGFKMMSGSFVSSVGLMTAAQVVASGCWANAFGVQGDNMLVAGVQAFAQHASSHYDDRFYQSLENTHKAGFGTGGENCTNPNKSADIMQLIFPYAFAGTIPSSPNMGFSCELRTRPSQTGGQCLGGEVLDKYTGYCVPADGRWVNGHAGKYGATNCPADGSNRDGVCYCNDSSDQVYGMCARDKKTNASDKDKKGDGYHVWVDNLSELEQNTADTVSKLAQTNNALNQIKTSVDAQKADLNGIKSAADSIKTDVQAMKTDVNKVATTLDSIKTLETQQKQTLDEINNSLNSIETNSDQQKADVEQIKTTVKQSQDTLALIKQDVNKSTSSLQQIQQDTQAVKTATEAIKQDSNKSAAALDAIKTDVQDAKSSLTQIETESKETNTLLQQVKSDTERSANSLNTIETNSRQISSDVSAIKTDAQTTATAVQAIKADVNKSAADLEAIKVDVQGSKTALDAIKTDAEASKTALQAIKTDAEASKTALQAIKTDIEQSKQDLAAIKQSSDKTADSLSTVKQDMAQTNTSLKEVQQDTGKMSTSLNNLETSVDKANTTLTQVKEDSQKIATDTADIKSDISLMRKTSEDVKELNESQKESLLKIKEDSQKIREDTEKIQKAMDGKFESPTLTNAPKSEQVNVLTTYNSAKDVTAAGSGACVPPPELKITFKGHTSEKAGDTYCTAAKVSNIFSYVMGALWSLHIILQ